METSADRNAINLIFRDETHRWANATDYKTTVGAIHNISRHFSGDLTSRLPKRQQTGIALSPGSGMQYTTPRRKTASPSANHRVSIIYSKKCPMYLGYVLGNGGA